MNREYGFIAVVICIYFTGLWDFRDERVLEVRAFFTVRAQILTAVCTGPGAPATTGEAGVCPHSSLLEHPLHSLIWNLLPPPSCHIFCVWRSNHCCAARTQSHSHTFFFFLFLVPPIIPHSFISRTSPASFQPNKCHLTNEASLEHKLQATASRRGGAEASLSPHCSFAHAGLAGRLLCYSALSKMEEKGAP